MTRSPDWSSVLGLYHKTAGCLVLAADNELLFAGPRLAQGLSQLIPAPFPQNTPPNIDLALSKIKGPRYYIFSHKFGMKVLAVILSVCVLGVC